MATAGGQDSVESQVRHAVITGELVDLHHSEDDHFFARHLSADDHVGQEIPAGLLIELLTTTQSARTPARPAVRLCGATITGSLNLETATLTCPLLLELCRFTEPVILDDATAPKLSLRGCHVPGFSARRLRTAGSLTLDRRFTTTAGADLTGARIGGQLLLNDARISRPHDLDSVAPGGTIWALAADSITVEEDLFARRFTTDGQVRLLSAHIKGQIAMTGAHLDASAARQLANPDRIAVLASNLTVGGDMDLAEASIQGQVYLRGASIEGQLVLDGASLASIGSRTLMAHHLSVGQDMSCSGEFASEGEFSLSAARIGGSLSFFGARLSNPGSCALDANWITIGKSLICRGGFTADGQIDLAAAQIGGQLLFLGASLNNPGGTALAADRVDIGQTMSFSDGSSAYGEVRMPGARIAGHSSFDGARLISPGANALDARLITVGSLLRFRKGFTADGQVSLEAARIGGHLEFDAAVLSNPSGTALKLKDADIAALSLCPAAPPVGAVDLTGTRVGAYADDPRTWPQTLSLRGFIYDTLENSEVSVRNRLRWLRLHPGGYTPQIYDQLVSCYQRAGHEEAARRVAIAKQRHRRNILSPLNWLWYITVGYGYRTWLAAIWLAAVTIAGTAAFSRAYNLHLLRPTPHAPAFQPLVYTMDTVLPIVDFGQKNAWTPTGWALPWSWSLTAAGWVLTTAAVAALTGIFKRD